MKERSGRETEKPKDSGWAAKSRLRSVDLPTPDGPQRMSGPGIGRKGGEGGGHVTRVIECRCKGD